MANKFDIPSLRQASITFLLPSAAGRPTLGLRIAEENSMCVAHLCHSRSPLAAQPVDNGLNLRTLREHRLMSLPVCRPELYKETSRYVLDNYSAWPAEDLALLSEGTLLKLERK